MHGIHGRKLKAVRKSAGMTQDALAEKSGISKMGISIIERGLNGTATIDTLVKLANALGVPIGDLIFIDKGAKHGRRRRESAAA